MRSRRPLSLLFLFSLLLPISMAGQGRVVVEQLGAKELKRSAHRLRISVEQLKNAREALREATELARHMDPLPFGQFSMVGHLWLQLDRSRAAATLESMVADLRKCAEKASEARNYQECTSAAQGLLAALAQFESERALQIAEQWPAPSASLGDFAEKTRSQLQRQFQSQYLARMVNEDPDRALAFLEQRPSGETSYSLRAQLAEQMMNSGRRDEAAKIVDQAIADFGQRSSDPRATHDYASFLQYLGRMNPDRFLDAFAALAQRENKPGPSVESAGQITIGTENVPVTSKEMALLHTLRNLQGRPELVLKALNNVPDLKAKVARFGGIDNFLTPNQWPARPAGFYSPDGSMRVSATSMGRGLAMASSGERDLPGQLFKELRGKAAKNPAEVRQKLAQVAEKPEQIDLLINLAPRSAHDDPDLSSCALEISMFLIPRVQPLERRASSLQNLIRAYRQVEGEVDQNLIKEGFILADQIREEQERKTQVTPNAKLRRSFNFADQLEIMLVGEYSRDHFNAAMQFARTISDENLKLSALVAIAQSQQQH